MCHSLMDKILLVSLAGHAPRISSHDCSKLFNEPHAFVLEMIHHVHEDYPKLFTEQHFHQLIEKNKERGAVYYMLTLEGFYFLCRYSLSNIAKECVRLHIEVMGFLSERLDGLLYDFPVMH